jgi:hypothetical protein
MSEYKKPSLKTIFTVAIFVLLIILLVGTQKFTNLASEFASRRVIITEQKEPTKNKYVQELEKGEENLEEKEAEIEENYEHIIRPGKTQYRREIILNNFENPETLKNFQICLELDTRSLIREEKLSFNCENIMFTDSDGKTKIPYWIRRNCGYEKTEIWLRIPEIHPFEEKKIYLYYGNENKVSSGSNFEEVFTKDEELKGWYYFDEPEKNEVYDLSGNKNNGTLSKLEYGLNWGGTSYKENDRYFVFFNDWHAEYEKDACVYFKIPSFYIFPSEGSIEMWIRPYMFNPHYGDLKRFHKILTDTNRLVELGIFPGGDLYFSPNTGYYDYNKSATDNFDLADLKVIPQQWNHILVTWKFKTREINFYLNGEKRSKKIENTKNYWYEQPNIGDLLIGSSELNIGSNFIGYIDGLRIYSKALSEKDAKKTYKYNSRNARFPKFRLGMEKVILKEKPSETFNFSKLKKLKPDTKISINLQYATPLDVSEEWGWGLYKLGEKNAFLIHKNEEDAIPVFGVPSHFFSYEGTKVSFKDSYMLYYVSLKLSNPELIKDLKIEFKEISPEYKKSFSDDYDYIGLIEKIIPSARACGPLYDYVIVGESEFELIKKDGDVYWYKLKKPIFVNTDTKMMQMYYKATGKEGLLTLKIEDMIFIDKNRNYVKPTYWQYSASEKYRYGTYHPVSEYRAWLTREEKGFITFKQDPLTMILEICFENCGTDPIIIDNQSINFIETQLIGWRITNFLIRDSNGKIFYTISMPRIKREIMNKTLQPGESLAIPLFLPRFKLKTDSYYYITAQTGEKTSINDLSSSKKIINWIIGTDPYHYTNTPFQNTQDISICSFYLNNSGNIGIVTYP